ncbi:circularly permuted type 2 ATP-grasp protein [bacterium]|nr:MAG: circularly permuted type 2 ATP-grasp protein [bacterium]
MARLAAMSDEEIARRERLQNDSLLTQGITFNVYGDPDEEGEGRDGRERVFPFDFVPRVVPAAEWRALEAGLVQRTLAINQFLLDVYTDQRCLHEGIIPWELVLTRKEYRRELRGVIPPRKVFTHVVGTDLIRDAEGTYRVLEDNCRCPSGVSYVVENRNLLQRTFPELFADHGVRPVRNYPQMLLETLGHVAPRWNAGRGGSLAVVLTPGSYNSAYFEHSFLAREMGVPLVEGSDLLVEENHVYVRTTEGRRRVEVIYRRVDDDYLDPVTFGHESVLGVPGLINAYRDGNVAIANAPGAGVADDKAVYAYIPELIRYYMGEEPLLEQVPTYTGFKPDDFAFMVENLDRLVVKTTGDAGGYGMLMGPFSTAEERTKYAKAMRANPGGYVAQELVEISSHPTRIGGQFAPRRVDLRPFILFGDRVRVLPGGLTRVALQEGSYVVNSSQGGGSKDTWVLDE